MTARKNYKSDFDAILHLVSCVGDTKKEIGWPDYDWVARFYTTSHDNVYIASNIGGVLTNCFNDNGNIHVVFNNHGLPSGTLRVEFSAEIPNDIYPDGSQLEVSPQPLDIELVRGRGDCGTIVDVDVMLSYIKGDKGDTGSQGPKGDKGDKGEDGKDGNGFTPEQVEKLNALPTASELDVKLDKAKFALFVDMWNEAAGSNGYARMVDGVFDCKLNDVHLTYNEATYHFIRSGTANYEANTSSMFYGDTKIRTTFPIKFGALINVHCQSMFFNCKNLEIVRIDNYCAPSRASGMFYLCSKLREISGVIQAVYAEWPYCDRMFDGCAELQEVRVEIKGNISFADSPKLSLASLSFMVETGNRYSTTAKTITVHPDVYAKLTDESNTEWNQVLTDAAAKNITFATV